MKEPKTQNVRLAGIRLDRTRCRLVGLLYKPNSDDGDSAAGTYVTEEAAPMNLLIAKQRNGSTGDVHLTSLKSYTRFESAAEVSDDDVPN